MQLASVENNKLQHTDFKHDRGLPKLLSRSRAGTSWCAWLKSWSLAAAVKPGRWHPQSVWWPSSLLLCVSFFFIKASRRTLASKLSYNFTPRSLFLFFFPHFFDMFSTVELLATFISLTWSWLSSPIERRVSAYSEIWPVVCTWLYPAVKDRLFGDSWFSPHLAVTDSACVAGFAGWLSKHVSADTSLTVSASDCLNFVESDRNTDRTDFVERADCGMDDDGAFSVSLQSRCFPPDSLFELLRTFFFSSVK